MSFMPPAETILTIFLSIIMGKIAYNSLCRYMKMPTNYEFTLYWGIAFSLLSLLTLIHGIEIYNINQISLYNISIGIILIMVPWFILFSVLFIVSDNYTAIMRKKIRTLMFFLLLFIMLSQSLIILYKNYTASLILTHLQAFSMYYTCFILLYKQIKSSKYVQLSLLLFSFFHLLFVIEIIISGDPAVYAYLRKVILSAGTIIIFLEVKSQLNRGVYSTPMLILKQIIEFIKEHFFKIIAALASILLFIVRNEKSNFLKKKAEEKENEHRERRAKIKEEKKKLKEIIEKYYNEEKIDEISKKEEEIDAIIKQINDENIKQAEIEERIEKLEATREELVKKREEEEKSEKFSEDEADEAYDYLNDVLDDDNTPDQS